ncbi:hypothetical protein FJY94_06455 [Candidatus Kaiserbacteria bacterium]|nr:hypothetical protein [Candidatus Kaiserbacteria bacterium]
MDKDTLTRLLRLACTAPSGDNVQPWRFAWDGETLTILNVPGIHNPFLDFDERGSYIAHGALLENLSIAAQHEGWEAHIMLFPDASAPDVVAHVSFTPAAPTTDPLFDALTVRATNRRPYETRPLASDEKAALLGSVREEGVKLRIIEDRAKIQTLAHASSRAEVVILDDARIAEHFFSGLVWSQKEERHVRAGFFVDTMELNPVQRFVFWLATKPRIMRFLRRKGLPDFIANEDTKLYAACSAFGALLIPDERKEHFIAAGRAMQRAWLTATAHGLAFQPLIGMCFIAYRSETGRGELAPAHAQLMRDALKAARDTIEADSSLLAVMFRVGPAPKPSATTSRKEPEISFAQNAQ